MRVAGLKRKAIEDIADESQEREEGRAKRARLHSPDTGADRAKPGRPGRPGSILAFQPPRLSFPLRRRQAARDEWRVQQKRAADNFRIPACVCLQ